MDGRDAIHSLVYVTVDEMAAVAADPNYQSHATAAESAGSCLRSFQECVQRAASIHPRELSLVEDQLARFSIWIANIKVFASGRASLDHRLREAPDVQDIVIGLFEALAFRIQSCKCQWFLFSTLYEKMWHPFECDISRFMAATGLKQN